MATIEIFGFAPSTYTQTALIAAAAADVDVELKPLEFKKPSHFALHPFGKMPALRHGNVQLFETLAVCSYVDGVFGSGKLQPKDPVEHARMLQWISVAVDYTYEDLVNGLNVDQPSSGAVSAAAEQLKLLDSALDGSFFAGKQFSLADAFLYPMVQFARGKLGDSALEGLPSLSSWHDAVSKQPSVRKVTR